MTQNSPHSPLKTLVFLILMGAVVWSFSLLPEKVELTDTLTFRLPQWPHFQEEGQEQERLADANSFLEGYEDLLREDSIAEVKNAELREAAIEDSLAIDKQRRRKLLSIQEGPEGIRNLKSFFQTLMKLPDSGKKVRVMHYGDSQIEADRITSYLRREWQKKWGGQGPGLVPPVEVVPSGNIKQRASEEWHRHTIYGRKDTTVKHTRFGALGTFASYDSTSASLFFEPSRLGYRQYKGLQICESIPRFLWQGGSVQLYQK